MNNVEYIKILKINNFYLQNDITNYINLLKNELPKNLNIVFFIEKENKYLSTLDKTKLLKQDKDKFKTQIQQLQETTQTEFNTILESEFNEYFGEEKIRQVLKSGFKTSIKDKLKEIQKKQLEDFLKQN